MKLKPKLEMAKQAVRFISRHDDARETEVMTALDRLQEFIEAERAEALARRTEFKEEAV